MGTCTSDPLGYISEKYGQDVCKYVVSLKSEDFLQQITPKVAKKVQQQINSCSRSLDRQLNNKEQKIRDFFDNILTQTLKQSRAALQGVKKRQQKNQEQIFGLTKIQDRFTKLKNNKDQKIKQHQDYVLALLQIKKSQIKQQILSKRPQLPQLQKLPFWQRDQALLDAEIRYDHQIKMRQEEIQEMLEGAVYFSNFQDTIRKTVRLDEANQLSKAAQSAFKRIKRNLTFSDNPKSCFI